MTKVLFINPNKWGRGVTHIWITSHAGILKKNGHSVDLFDATFYAKNWSIFENDYNTGNKQYKPSPYLSQVKYSESDVYVDLKKKINTYKPDIIFWSAISSHIHGEGEYVNIENGYVLLEKIKDINAYKITGGMQATASPENVFKKLPNIDILIRGESELVLLEICNKIRDKNNFFDTRGLSFKKNNTIINNKPQPIISNLDLISPYDYSLFEKNTFLRPYNGKVVNAVDYEMSRGCIYSCAYCVETVIQKYYGFNERTKSGAIKNFKNYLRNKSPKIIFQEMEELHKKYNIELFRMQDTNFLTIDRKTLIDLSVLISNSNFDIKLYIETRPEGINEKTINLLKNLKVDGIGMGIELASENFREGELNRFADQDKIIEAFRLLKVHKIKRTAYNVIGFPNQKEDSIISTIEFNKLLKPDNITVAFYSPYQGTDSQINGIKAGIFEDFESNVDSQLRSVSKDKELSKNKLEYYKSNFVELVAN